MNQERVFQILMGPHVSEKAAIVVIDVSMMARPTRVSVMVPDSEALLPSLRSSL